MNFPLLKLPIRVIYVDDKGNFLEVLRQTLPKRHAREFITSPLDAVDRLTKEADYWRALINILSTSAIAEDETQGFAQRLVSNYFNDWSRFHLTSVLNVDYAMPSMNGLDMIRQIGNWPGRRVLLTGEADTAVAIDAFNSGLIHKFIPKSTPNLYRVLKQAYEEMHRNVCEHIGHLVQPTLTVEQRDILSNPSVISGLDTMIKDLEWVEYITVGAPFGLLGMGHSGKLQWLQLETASSIKALAEMADEAGYSPEDVQHLRAGSFLINLELNAELGVTKRADLREATILSRFPQVFAATFTLDVPALNAKDYGIDDIMSPLESVRAHLRDIKLTERQECEQPIVKLEPGHSSATDMGWAHGSVQTLLNQLLENCRHSVLHKQALRIAISEVPVSDVVASRIQTFLTLETAKQQP
jgi:CheY-like chemotaxis protein